MHSANVIGVVGVQKHRQWPISARPTQLNASMEDAIATTDAKVTMVLTDSIPDPRWLQRTMEFCRTTFVLSRRDSPLDYY
jgi:hypothetical protein